MNPLEFIAVWSALATLAAALPVRRPGAVLALGGPPMWIYIAVQMMRGAKPTQRPS